MAVDVANGSGSGSDMAMVVVVVAVAVVAVAAVAVGQCVVRYAAVGWYSSSVSGLWGEGH